MKVSIIAMSDCDVVATSSLDSNVAPCEQIHEPTSTVTPLEKQQYLQYIVDTVAEHFPDLGFLLGFDGQDRNNPFLTISQRSLCSHSPHGMTSHVNISLHYKYRVHEAMERRRH